MELDVICKQFQERRRIDMRWPFVSRRRYEQLEVEQKRLVLASQQAYNDGYIEGYNKVRRMDVTDYMLERLAREWKVFPDGGQLRVDSRSNEDVLRKFNEQRKKDET